MRSVRGTLASLTPMSKLAPGRLEDRVRPGLRSPLGDSNQPMRRIERLGNFCPVTGQLIWPSLLASRRLLLSALLQCYWLLAAASLLQPDQRGTAAPARLDLTIARSHPAIANGATSKITTPPVRMGFCSAISELRWGPWLGMGHLWCKHVGFCSRPFVWLAQAGPLPLKGFRQRICCKSIDAIVDESR